MKRLLGASLSGSPPFFLFPMVLPHWEGYWWSSTASCVFSSIPCYASPFGLQHLLATLQSHPQSHNLLSLLGYPLTRVTLTFGPSTLFPTILFSISLCPEVPHLHVRGPHTITLQLFKLPDTQFLLREILTVKL